MSSLAVPGVDVDDEADDEKIAFKRPEESQATFSHEKSSNEKLKEAAIEAGIYTNEELEESKKIAEERFSKAINIASTMVEESNDLSSSLPDNLAKHLEG